MSIVVRNTTLADIPLIQRIVDAYQHSFDPDEKRMGEGEARELVEGFFEPSTTLLCRSEANDDWDSLISLHPDVNRSRFYLDLYFLPECNILEEIFSLALKRARDEHPDWQLWLGVHKKDDRFREVLERRGFSILRKYWLMEMNLDEITSFNLPADHSIVEVNIHERGEREKFWQIHQDSFGKHFGFKERSFDDWSELLLRNAETMRIRVWLLMIQGEATGFVETSEELIHEDTGYVAGLGVRQGFQGRGFGEILLRFAISHESSLGRRKLALNVDTGNESGALRLYEKVGMKPISEWHQYENPQWSTEEVC